MKKLYLMVGRTLNKRVTYEIRNKIAGISLATDLTIVDTFKGNKLQSLLKGIKCKFIKYNVSGLDNWNEIEQYNKAFIEKYGIQNFMLVGLDMMTGIKFDDRKQIERILSRYQKEPTIGLNYVSTRKVFEKVMFVKNCAEAGINTMHFVIDPQEAILHAKRFYKLRREGCEYLPSYELFLITDGIEVCNDDRKYNVVFGCGAQTKDREWILKIKNRLESIPKSKIAILTKENANEGIPQKDYVESLREARFTFVIPSYDRTTFSIVRFLEAIKQGCIPLVFSNCCLLEVKDTFPQIYKVIAKSLLVENVGEIKQKIKNMTLKEMKQIQIEIMHDKKLRNAISAKHMREEYEKVLI